MMESSHAAEGSRRAKPGESVANAEQRNAERIVCRASVQWTYFNEHQQHQAQMLNHSDTGVYLSPRLS